MFSGKGNTKVDLKRALKGDASSAPYAQPSFQMNDMRRASRKDLWCECSLTSFGAEVREAVIVDISQKCARVRFRRRGSLPETVHIRAARIGLNRTARVAWQTVFDAGLEFYKPGETPPREQPKVTKVNGANSSGFGRKSG